MSLPRRFITRIGRHDGWHHTRIILAVEAGDGRLDLFEHSLIGRDSIEDDCGVQIRHFGSEPEAVSPAHTHPHAGTLGCSARKLSRVIESCLVAAQSLFLRQLCGCANDFRGKLETAEISAIWPAPGKDVRSHGDESLCRQLVRDGAHEIVETGLVRHNDYNRSLIGSHSDTRSKCGWAGLQTEYQPTRAGSSCERPWNPP